ncbi:hypothetical protein XH93_24065 [Bradyrhizobium sp. CCBAU 51753]|nr:hypothetical protein XH93_24065 [Bradyrhizobium sp. CCBAU 51753]
MLDSFIAFANAYWSCNLADDRLARLVATFILVMGRLAVSNWLPAIGCRPAHLRPAAASRDDRQLAMSHV